MEISIIIEEIDKVKNEAWIQLKKIPDGNLKALTGFTKVLEGIDKLRDDTIKLQYKYSESLSYLKDSQLNEVCIPITLGAIKESYLVLTAAFAENLIDLDIIDQSITIITPSEEFTTSINSNKRLKSRGKISKFYQESDLDDSDEVIFRKIDERTFEISPLSYRYIEVTE